MAMDGTGLSVADALALQNRDNDGFMGNDWMMMLFLFFLLAAGGTGFGVGAGGALGQTITRAEMCDGFNTQNIENGIRGVQQGLCDGFYAMNTGMLNGFNGIERDLCTGFSAVNQGISNLGFQMQNCCCETNRNIDAIRYENAKNTCDIIAAQNAGVQRIIDHMTANEIQTLRDSLQTANFQLSQQAQSANIIENLRPCAKPAYLTCSPYESAFPNACFNSCC